VSEQAAATDSLMKKNCSQNFYFLSVFLNFFAGLDFFFPTAEIMQSQGKQYL